MFNSVEVDGVNYPLEPIRGIDPTSFQPYLGFKVVIGGQQKTIAARYNLQLSTDLKDAHGLVLEVELENMMKAEIANEIKRYLESL